MTIMNEGKKKNPRTSILRCIIFFLICTSFLPIMFGLVKTTPVVIFPTAPFQIPSERIPLNYSVDFISYLDKQNSILVINSSSISVLDEQSYEITWEYHANWTIHPHSSLISMNQNAILLAGEYVSFIEIGANSSQWTFNKSGSYNALSISKNEHLFTFRNRTNTFVYFFNEENWEQILRFDEEGNEYFTEDQAFYEIIDGEYIYETGIILSDNEEWIIRIIEKEQKVEFYRKNESSYVLESNPFSDIESFKKLSEYPRSAFFSQNDTILVGFSTYNIIYADFTNFSVKTLQFVSDDVPTDEIFHYRVNNFNNFIYSRVSYMLTITKFDPNKTDSFNHIFNEPVNFDRKIYWIYPPESMLYKIEYRWFSHGMSSVTFPFLECYNYSSQTTLWWGTNEESQYGMYYERYTQYERVFKSVESYRVNPIIDNGNFFYYNQQANEIQVYTGNLTNEREWINPYPWEIIYKKEIGTFLEVSLISLCVFIAIYIVIDIALSPKSSGLRKKFSMFYKQK